MASKRTWLITGVSSGIGAALAGAALSRGDIVAGTSRDGDALARFEALAPGRTIGLRLDMVSLAQGQAIDALLQAAGPIDILVNNAGQSLFGAFEETMVSEAKALFDINVFGPWAMMQAVLPQFRERGRGTIINISSGCGLLGTPGLSAYCASKFALEGMTETLAQEVAALGIRTMLVEPGAIATRFISNGTNETSERMAAYDFLTGQGKAMLEGYYTASAAPPETVADAIIAALDAPLLPLRLPIGPDMQAALRHKAAELSASADA